jgi:hypothetical protein
LSFLSFLIKLRATFNIQLEGNYEQLFTARRRYTSKSLGAEYGASDLFSFFFVNADEHQASIILAFVSNTQSLSAWEYIDETVYKTTSFLY